MKVVKVGLDSIGLLSMRLQEQTPLVSVSPLRLFHDFHVGLNRNRTALLVCLPLSTTVPTASSSSGPKCEVMQCMPRA